MTKGIITFASSWRRVLACSSRTFPRIISSVIGDGSVGWFCQIALGSSPENSFRMATSVMEPPRQDGLDPVNPHSHIPCRQPCDFPDGRRVYSFQIRDDDLAVQRLELLN